MAVNCVVCPLATDGLAGVTELLYEHADADGGIGTAWAGVLAIRLSAQASPVKPAIAADALMSLPRLVPNRRMRGCMYASLSCVLNEDGLDADGGSPRSRTSASPSGDNGGQFI